jgi:hypothetical protein
MVKFDHPELGRRAIILSFTLNCRARKTCMIIPDMSKIKSLKFLQPVPSGHSLRVKNLIPCARFQVIIDV